MEYVVVILMSEMGLRRVLTRPNQPSGTEQRGVRHHNKHPSAKYQRNMPTKATKLRTKTPTAQTTSRKHDRDRRNR